MIPKLWGELGASFIAGLVNENNGRIIQNDLRRAWDMDWLHLSGTQLIQ